MTLRYSDIDPNVIELLARQLATPLDKLIEDKLQRRQQWGPTFKQEDIADLTMTDADYVVKAPDYGKRVIRMAGSLTAPRILRLPPIPSAWWIIHNRTSQALTCLTDPTGITGPTIPANLVGAVYTDGVGVWQFACCGEAGTGGALSGAWRWSTALTGDVADGYVRVDTNDPSLATTFCIAEQNIDHVDATNILNAVAVNSQFYIQDRDNAAIWIRYIVTGLGTDHGSYRCYPVSLVGYGGLNFANNTFIQVVLTPVGGGDVPAGTGTEIQYRLNATTFGAVGFSGTSGTSGENVFWGGTQIINKAGNRSNEMMIDPTGSQMITTVRQFSTGANGIAFNFERGEGTFLSQSILADGGFVAQLGFFGRTVAPPAALTQLGYLNTRYTTSLGGGSIVTLGAGATNTQARIEIGQGASGSYIQLFGGGTSTFQIQPGGIVLSGGVIGSLFYQGPLLSGVSYLTPLGAGTEGQVLKWTSGLPAWGAAAGASVPSLDQITNPTANKVFGMGNNQLSFQYTGAEAEDCMAFESASNATGSGAVLLVRTQGTFSTKVPFLVTANGNTSIATLTNGNVGIRSVGDAGFALTVDVAPAQFRFGSYNQRSSAVLTDLTFDSLATLTGAATQTPLWYPNRIDLTDSSTAGVSLPNRTTLFVRYRRNATEGGVTRSVVTAEGFSNAGTLSGELRGFTAQADIAGSLTTWCGFYAAGAGGIGAVTNERGFVAEGGTVNGFGTVSPANTLHVAGSVRFDLGSDVAGDLYFRSATVGPLSALHPTTNGYVLTLSAGLPIWAPASGSGGGGAFPGTGANGTIQYKVDATTFGSMSNSAVLGSNLFLGGNLTFDNTAGSLMTFKRSVNAGDETTVGMIEFWGQLSGIATQFGRIRSYYSGSDGVVEMAGESGLAAFRVNSTVATITTGGNFFSVQTGGIKLSLGGVGCMYYKVGGDGTLASLEPAGVSDGWVVSFNSTTGLPEWRSVSSTGGIANTGGVTNSIQYKLTGTTMGGIATSTAGGILMVTGAANSVAAFSTTFNNGVRYSFSPSNSIAGLNCGVNLSLAAGSNPTSAQHGDIYYNQFAGKFRFYQNGAWVELGGGGGGGTAGGSATQLQYNTGSGFGGIGGTGFATGILNLGDGTTGLRTKMQSTSVLGLAPTLDIDYFLTGSSTIDDTYAARMHFHHQHAGNATPGSRKLLTLHWDQSAAGTNTGTKLDAVFEIYAANTSGLSLGSTGLVGIYIDAGSGALSNWGQFYGLWIKPVTTNTSTKYSIYCEAGSGSAVFNGGGADLALGATSGFVYLPTIAGTGTQVPTGTPAGVAGAAPICIQWQTGKLWMHTGSAWKSLTFV